MPSASYLLGENVPQPNSETDQLINDFRTDISTIESLKSVPFILLQDGKSLGYYIECHVKTSDFMPLIDNDAVLDPDEQEQFRLQRELQPNNPAFIRICIDANAKRQFSDIIAELNYDYKPERPLKILGGQHRIEAIKRALENNHVSEYHGFKIFFGLSVDQRNEIAQIANTNIAISTDLLDRMQETVRGPQLRDFCHQIDLLQLTDDFADRKNPEGKITVRLARTFVVNFFEGEKNKKQDLETQALVPYVCKSGQEDPKYLELARKKIWQNANLIEAGKRFAELHKKQTSTVLNDAELNKAEFRNKAMSMAVLASWSFTAGLLQDNKDALEKFYLLPRNSGDKDPLAAKAMSESSHPKDPSIYRGLGARYSDEDRGRVTELFVQYAKSATQKRISKPLIESAIMTYEAKVSAIKARKLKEKVL